MLPLLNLASDGKEHTQAEAISRLAIDFNLTEDELNETRHESRQTKFDNRIAWAKFHMKKAGLFVFPRRAFFQITDLGQQVLAQNLHKIGLSFLKQFPDYLEFVGSSKPESEKFALPEIVEESATPEEIMARGYLDIRRALAAELLERVSSEKFHWKEFERLVIKLLVKMGYGGGFKDSGTHTGKPGDGGIDGTIREDKLGLDMIYIQAKRWSQGQIVRSDDIRHFCGALAEHGVKKGVFITTSSFDKKAREFSIKNDIKIVLIDGKELVEFMIDYNLGVSISDTYEIKRVDNYYFGDE